MDWQRYHAESARETSEQCLIGSIWDPKSRQIHRRSDSSLYLDSSKGWLEEGEMPFTRDFI